MIFYKSIFLSIPEPNYWTEIITCEPQRKSNASWPGSQRSHTKIETGTDVNKSEIRRNTKRTVRVEIHTGLKYREEAYGQVQVATPGERGSRANDVQRADSQIRRRFSTAEKL